MNRLTKILTLCVAALSLHTIVSAQEVDLASQRGESQSAGNMLGEKLDHGGLIINPIPHKVAMLRSLPLDVRGGVSLSDKAVNYASQIDFLKQTKSGVKLSVEFDQKALLQMDVPKVCINGAYALNIGNGGISIVAADDAGAFYAIQTLRQIVSSPKAEGSQLPALSIIDWPSLHYRGVVEGFYGEPWSHETRLSLIELYGRYKMNYYIYGPKDDPYHSSPNWRKPYPKDEAKNLKELVEACKKNRVNFVWAIHPGQDIQWNEEDYNNLVNKFEHMYDLGVRAFAIHFDDISGEGTDPYRQTALLNRLNKEFVKKKGDVASLIVCPTDYTRLWAGNSLVIYGNELDESVDVFWTGDAVCSDMTESTMAWISERIQRPALFWWNFPVTDYARHIVMQGPVYGLATTHNRNTTRGLVSNPMEYGEASKLALYSVADYTWNTEVYNPIDSWERGIEAIAPEVKEAYRDFAIHSCDTETGYRRWESWETETFTMAEYDAEVAKRLYSEMEALEDIDKRMEPMKNKALLAELRPWLVELSRLAKRCRKAIECYDLYAKGDLVGFWNSYVDNLMTEEQIASFDAHRCGTMELHPFYEQLMNDMAIAYYKSITGMNSTKLSTFGVYNSLKAPQSKYMFDNDPETYYHSGEGQRTNDYVAVDMSGVSEVREVRIVQGRNSVDDVDYFDHAVVEYSVDGNIWLPLTDALEGVYEITWTGSVEARYIRLRKLESKKRNWLAIRSFEVNPVDKSEFGWDGNPFTSLQIAGGQSFELPKGGKVAYLMLGKLPKKGAVCRLLNNKGEEISKHKITSSFHVVELNDDVYALDIRGKVELFETLIYTDTKGLPVKK